MVHEFVTAPPVAARRRSRPASSQRLHDRRLADPGRKEKVSGHDFGQVSVHARPSQARGPGVLPARPDPAQDANAGKDGALGAGIGALAGAGAGAGIGAAVGGPLGALIGAGIGALAGGLVGYLVGRRRSVTINITKLTGAGSTADADLSTANTVFGQAGVSVSRGAERTLSAAESTAILGGDNALDEFSGPVLTAEETRLLAYNRTPGRMTAYWVPSLSAGSRGESMIPSYHGVTDSSIVISSSARAADTFAHELGHCLLDEGSHSSDPSNLMASGSIRNFTDKLTSAQIEKIQSSRYV